MEKLQRLIYIIAGLNLAWGTGEFTLHAFADPVAGWRNAIVTVACVELLFVLLVVAAKQRKISGWWSVAPLAVTAMVQAAKVSGDVMTAKNTIEGVLMVAVAVASVLALGCVVYLFELRGQTPAQAAPEAQGEAFGTALVSQAVEGAMNALQPKFEAMSQAHTAEVAQLRGMIEGATTQQENIVGWLQSLESQIAVQPEPQLVAQLPQPTQPGKIDKTQLVAQLEQGMSATDLAQLFGVSAAAIRKTPEWKAAKAVQS